MLPTPRVAAARLGLFTAAEAVAVGWSPDALARAVRRRDLVRWRRGVYSRPWPVGSPVPMPRRADIDLARTAVAASLTTPAAVATGLAAAVAHDWPVWARHPRACVVVDDGRTRVPGVHVHRTPLDGDVRTVAGYRLTRPARTILDVACEFGTEAGLVIADAALARDRLTAAELEAAVANGAGRTGIAAARPVAILCDGRAESPLESRSRWQCLRHGLPAPLPQVRILDLEGRFVARVDLYWEDGVVGEVDGAGKLLEPGARTALLQRQTGMTRTGLRVTRWGNREVEDFGATAAWIREELVAAEVDPRPRRWLAVPT